MTPKDVASCPTLPTPPMVALRLLELTAPESNADLSNLVKVIESDPAIAAKLLSVANSAYFGFRSTLESISRAVAQLGMQISTSIVLTFSFADFAKSGKQLQQYWRASILQAIAADAIGERSKTPGEHLSAGLLCDVGRLALLRTLPGEYARVCEHAEYLAEPLSRFEEAAFGFDHAEVGATVLETWGVPKRLVEAVRQHNAPIAEICGWSLRTRSLEIIAAMAAAMGDYVAGYGRDHAFCRICRLGEAHFQWGYNEIDSLLNGVTQRVAERAELYALSDFDSVALTDILAQAGDRLADATAKAHSEKKSSESEVATLRLKNEKLFQVNSELRTEAVRDSLTGAFNRRYLEEVLAQEIFRSRRSGSSLAIAVADIDEFKRFNDEHGHNVGDQILIRVATALSGSLRRSDTLCRYGGEEFVAVIVSPQAGTLHDILERMRRSVETAHKKEDGLSPVSVSIGCVLLTSKFAATEGGDEDTVARQLIHAADQALYRAKQLGRNRVVVSDAMSCSPREVASIAQQDDTAPGAG